MRCSRSRTSKSIIAVRTASTRTPGRKRSSTMNLKFKKLDDFAPEAIVEKVPELRKMIEFRETLTALKGPLGNMPAFRKKIQELILADKASASSS